MVDRKLDEQEEQERQQAIRDYMEEYNAQFRTKTLMEEHAGRKNKHRQSDNRSHNQKLKDQMGKAFDREKDLKYSGIDSQRAFGIINKNNLDKRFAPGGSYL